MQRWNFATKQTDDLDLVAELANRFPEFPAGNLAALGESLDGTVTVQTLVPSKVNRSVKVYNTVSLNPDFSISALRVMANPKVEYAAMAEDIILTLDCGTIRKWKLVPDPDNRASQVVKPVGVLQGFYQNCQVSADGSQLLVIERGSGLIKVLNPKTGDLVSDIELPADIATKPTAIAWSKTDSPQVAIGFESGAIRIFNMVNGSFELDAIQPEVHATASGSIKSLIFAAGTADKNSNGSLLAVLKDDDDVSKYAVVYQRVTPDEPESAGVGPDDVGAEKEGAGTEEIWSPVVIGYPDGESRIVTGHLSADGTRAVTGSNTGHLTLWRTDLLKTDLLAEVQGDKKLDEEQIKQRELLDVHDYSSPVHFAQFFENPDNKDLVDIISADEGGVNETVNEIEIYKTAE